MLHLPQKFFFSSFSFLCILCYRGCPPGKWSPDKPVQLHRSSRITGRSGGTFFHVFWRKGSYSRKCRRGRKRLTHFQKCALFSHYESSEMEEFYAVLLRCSASVNSGPSLDPGFWWASLIWIQGTSNLTSSLELKPASRWSNNTTLWSALTWPKHWTSRTFNLLRLRTQFSSPPSAAKLYVLSIEFLMFVNLQQHPQRRTFCWLWASSSVAVGAPGGHHHRAAVAEVGRSPRSCYRHAPGWSLQPPVPHSQRSRLITHPTSVFFFFFFFLVNI